MKDYKANIITALIFLLLIGSGFLAIEIRDKRAEEKVRAEEQREREIREKTEAKGNENKEKVLEELDKYIEELEADEEHKDIIKYTEDEFHECVIKDISYIKKVKELLEKSYVYYYEYEQNYPVEFLDVFVVDEISIVYYVSGLCKVKLKNEYKLHMGESEELGEVFREIREMASERSKKN